MNLSSGQKVKIRTYKKRPNSWNSDGHMDCYMGKTVTVVSYSNSSFRIEEDGQRWVWEKSDIDVEVSNDPNAIFKRRKNTRLGGGTWYTQGT